MKNKLKGITIIEAGLWVLLMSLSMVAGAQYYKNNRQNDLFHSEAQYMQKMQKMTISYMNQHRDDIEHMRSSSDNILVCNASFNLCNIDPQLLMSKIASSTGDLGTNSKEGALDAYKQSSFIRILRTGIAPNYTFNGLIVTDHSIRHDNSTLPATDLLGNMVDVLGLNGGVSAADGNTYGYQGAWSTPMANWKFQTCNGCLAYRFGDWAGDPSNAQYLPLDGSKAMQGAMNLANFNITNVNNVLADTAIVGRKIGTEESSAIVNNDVNAKRLDYIESKNGLNPLGIKIGANLSLNTTYNTATGTASGLSFVDTTKGINFLGSSFYANNLTTQNSGAYGVRTTSDLNTVGTMNILGTTTVNASNSKNFVLGGLDNYQNLTINAPSLVDNGVLGSTFKTNQLTVDGNSTIDYFGLNKFSGTTDASTKLLITDLYIPTNISGGNLTLNTKDIQSTNLEAYTLGANVSQGGTTYGLFTSPVYSNMIITKYVNDTTAFNKYGLNTNINSATITTVNASGTGVAIATCPAGYYAYGGGPNVAATTPGAGAGCTDNNDWANGVKSQQQSNYPVGVTQWALVCTYPGANPPSPITANVTVKCYQPSTL